MPAALRAAIGGLLSGAVVYVLLVLATDLQTGTAEVIAWGVAFAGATVIFFRSP
jgi:hypothetical protein